jgi:hypothetical protein
VTFKEGRLIDWEIFYPLSPPLPSRERRKFLNQQGWFDRAAIIVGDYKKTYAKVFYERGR